MLQLGGYFKRNFADRCVQCGYWFKRSDDSVQFFEWYDTSVKSVDSTGLTLVSHSEWGNGLEASLRTKRGSVEYGDKCQRPELGGGFS